MIKLKLKLNVGSRLASGFGAMAALLVVVGAVGFYGMYSGNQNVRGIIDKEWAKSVRVHQLLTLANANQDATFKLALTKDPAARAKTNEGILLRKKQIDDLFTDIEARLYKDEGKARLAKMKETRAPYVATFAQVVELTNEGKFDEARETALKVTAPSFDKFKEAIESLDEYQTQLVNVAGEEAVATYVLDRNVMFGIGALALLVGGLLALFSTRHITRATGQLGDTVAKIAGGDYDARSKVKSGDELEDLSTAFDKMLDERVAGLAQKEKDSELLNNSIIDILRSVAKTAQGDLTIHAPVREDITGALSDAINSMTDSTAKTLAGVTSMSHEVRSASQKGRDTVQQTSRGMNDIRGTIQETGKRIKRLGERSQEITGIVKLIDDIAERTSVLALNANMQAAMAGEAGRGFRVVADEVQRLAERSKEATDQIGKLVNTIQAETNETMTTMDRAIGEVVKGGELADKAAQQVTHLDALGEQLIESVKAFKLPEELLKETGSGERDTRRAA
jgi:methyl-accepting chemotaxis protein